MLETRFKKWEESVLERGIEIGIEKGREEGLIEGIEKGIEKGKLDVAEKLIERQMSDDEIRIITGLSLEKIRELRKKKKK